MRCVFLCAFYCVFEMFRAGCPIKSDAKLRKLFHIRAYNYNVMKHKNKWGCKWLCYKILIIRHVCWFARSERMQYFGFRNVSELMGLAVCKITRTAQRETVNGSKMTYEAQAYHRLITHLPQTYHALKFWLNMLVLYT